MTGREGWENTRDGTGEEKASGDSTETEGPGHGNGDVAGYDIPPRPGGEDSEQGSPPVVVS